NPEIRKLLQSTKEAFEKSDIKKYAEASGNRWYYSISSTKLSKHSPLLVGFNWGAKPGLAYEPQLNVPAVNFKELHDRKNELGPFQRAYMRLKKYLPGEDVDNFIQTNLCFFRSAQEYQLSDYDIELCKPLFEKLISIIQPKRIIGFSKKFNNYITSRNLGLNIKFEDFQSNKKIVHVVKGDLKINQSLVPFCILPHPNERYTGDALNIAYKFCFGEIQN
ncbi:MAG TPA: hypothetical protein VI583_18605, partial [Cyclobacteriaceae bacterium]|nr:hypothetical protein [Cyclobacteriaceae bacterium]